MTDEALLLLLLAARRYRERKGSAAEYQSAASGHLNPLVRTQFHGQDSTATADAQEAHDDGV